MISKNAARPAPPAPPGPVFLACTASPLASVVPYRASAVLARLDAGPPSSISKSPALPRALVLPKTAAPKLLGGLDATIWNDPAGPFPDVIARTASFG